MGDIKTIYDILDNLFNLIIKKESYQQLIKNGIDPLNSSYKLNKINSEIKDAEVRIKIFVLLTLDDEEIITEILEIISLSISPELSSDEIKQLLNRLKKVTREIKQLLVVAQLESISPAPELSAKVV